VGSPILNRRASFIFPSDGRVTPVPDALAEIDLRYSSPDWEPGDFQLD
jgi:hypothetical protein